MRQPMKSWPTCRSSKRHALSIMEVLFAIGVLTIGMLGIASILPVATNNAAMTLERDRAVEEMNNRAAADIAKLKSSFDDVIIANRSLANFNASQTRFNQISTRDFGLVLTSYDPFSTSNVPNLPEAFCIDPWFLTAANTVRNDLPATTPNNNRNAYDRTMFPCLDPRYQPIDYSPSDALSTHIALQWDTPRFTRIALPSEGNAGILSAMAAEVSTRQSDDFSLVLPTGDQASLPPGLFVRRSGNGARSLARSTVSSRYSSMLMMARSQTGSNIFDASVVTMRDRHVVTNDGAAPALLHRLDPYIAADPSVSGGPSPDPSLTLFPSEQLGYVSYAEAPFSGGGGGSFSFRCSRFVKPDLRRGSWICLMRRQYARAPGPTIIPGALKYSWYRVNDVGSEPELVTNGSRVYYETTISVTGSDWLFHPIQSLVSTSPLVYSAPYFGNTIQPNWGSGTVFDLDSMAARGTAPNFSGGVTPFYEHQDYGTIVVMMPDVINVRQFQVQL